MARKQAKKAKTVDKKPAILIIADGLTEIKYFEGFIKTKTNLSNIYHIDYQGGMKNTTKVLEYIHANEFMYEHIFALTDRDSGTNTEDTYESFCR